MLLSDQVCIVSSGGNVEHQFERQPCRCPLRVMLAILPYLRFALRHVTAALCRAQWLDAREGSFVRIDQACFGRSGGFAPVSLPLFQGSRLWGDRVAFTCGHGDRSMWNWLDFLTLPKRRAVAACPLPGEQRT